MDEEISTGRPKYTGRRIARATIGLLLDIGIITGSILAIVYRGQCPDELGVAFVIFILSLCVNLPRFAMEIAIICKKLGKCALDHPRVLCIFYIIFTIAKFILSVVNLTEVILIWGEPLCILKYRAPILAVDIAQMVSCAFDIWFLVDSRDQLRKSESVVDFDND